MCGIAGFTLSDLDYASYNTAKIVRSLALDIEHRGGDATGVLTVNRRGDALVRKAPTRATDFMWQRPGLGRSAKLALIHTRFATQGSKSNNNNNHPISYGDIIGVHNGHIDNDSRLFREEKWDRIGQVDSEIIFASLHHNPSAVLALEKIEGWMAIAWINVHDPFRLRLARGFTSPLHIAMTKNKSLFFASEKWVLNGLVKDGLVDEFDWDLDVGTEGVMYNYDPNVQDKIWRATFTPHERIYIPTKRYAGTGWEWGGEAWDSTIVNDRFSGGSLLSLPTGHTVTPKEDWVPKMGDRVHDVKYGHRVGTVQFVEPLTGECLVEWEPSVEEYINLRPMEQQDFAQTCIDTAEVVEEMVATYDLDDDEEEDDSAPISGDMLTEEEWQEILQQRWAAVQEAEQLEAADRLSEAGLLY